jgi:manganese/zinc/iron transport system permease protein
VSAATLSIVGVGALVGASCALLGCFLVLRRLAMLGDAISHAVLPGIVIAFLLTGSRSSLPMFVGAVLVGALTAFLVQLLSERGVQGDAAIGVTFTTLFAVGVLLVSLYGSQVDLDLDCVLYGEIAYAPFDTITFAGRSLGPRALWTNGALLLVNAALVGVFAKQFKLCAFDPEMAAAVGIPVALFHYLLMGLVAATTVGAFESVGAILVVAMLIVPAATAFLLARRLSTMIAIAIALGVAASGGGYLLARVLDCSIAGAMATVGGGFFFLALLFSPSQGIVSRVVAQARIRARVGEEDVLLWAGRRREAAIAGAPAGFTLDELARLGLTKDARTEAAAKRLSRSGELAAEGSRFVLTDRGAERATALLRRHRLYESYLGELGYSPDHVHAPADRVEHYITPTITHEVEEAARHPALDPQGKAIPPDPAAS